MQGRIVNKNITTHGGIVPVMKKLQDLGVPQLIRDTLGKIKAPARCQYDDILISWVLMSMLGHTRIAQIIENKKTLEILKSYIRIPTHDTIGRLMKKLATPTERIVNTRSDGIRSYEVNENLKMNELLTKVTKRIGMLNENRSYTLDIDATFIATERRGAYRSIDPDGKLNYSQVGFYPLVCTIGNLPVFISMRNGNTGSKYNLKGGLERCIHNLGEEKIRIGTVISDAAGYSKSVMEMLNNRGIKFLMRFPCTESMKGFRNNLEMGLIKWQRTEIETANEIWDCEIADIPYKAYTQKTWRVVAVRIPTEKYLKSIGEIGELKRRKRVEEKLTELRNRKWKNKPEERVLKGASRSYQGGQWKEIGNYMYKFFVTNYRINERSNTDLVHLYNRKRGNAERKFSFLKQDFGWRIPPFCEMNHNTVYLIAAALANNIFRAMARMFKKYVPGLSLRNRLKKFIDIFMKVVCECINGIFEFSNTNIGYDKIMVLK